MKTLWITNLFFPEFYELKGQKAPVMGGWMKALADSLINVSPEIELAIASPWPESSNVEMLKSGKYTFFTLPVKANNTIIDDSSLSSWKEIKLRFNPDIVHIHGTEFTHGLGWINANGNDNVLVSIQGLVSIYARYAEGGIKFSRFRDLTLHDLIRRSFPDQIGKKLSIAGIGEQTIIRSVNHIIGRTSWDRDHVMAINSDVNYHFCNENLRSPFYNESTWNKNKCIPHRIFLSQAAKPIKGIHMVIKALPLILKYYPDTEVYVAGNNFASDATFRQKLKYNGYAKYINRLIKMNGVREHIHFTGFLDARQMADQYRKANVFICPSSIENSPNSLGEAQLIGTPVVASYVGGIPDMVKDGETGLLYRFEEYEMLAEKVCRIFSDEKLALHLSNNAHNTAAMRHDRNLNAQTTIEIYNSIQHD